MQATHKPRSLQEPTFLGKQIFNEVFLEFFNKSRMYKILEIDGNNISSSHTLQIFNNKVSLI